MADASTEMRKYVAKVATQAKARVSWLTVSSEEMLADVML